MKGVRTYNEGLIGFEFNAYAYSLLYDAIVNNRPLAKCIPDFVIKESLNYFEKREQYVKCSIIKRFFDMNKNRMFEMSRNDWMNYGWNMPRM